MRDVQTVVVGYDGSADAEEALDTAAHLVTPNGVIHVVIAYSPLSENETAYLWSELPEEFRSNFDPLFEPHEREAKARRTLTERGIAHETHVAKGKPAAVILEAAENLGADLVVVGSRGLGTAARFVRGSVSTRVATHSSTNVLIVHRDADED